MDRMILRMACVWGGLFAAIPVYYLTTDVFTTIGAFVAGFAYFIMYTLQPPTRIHLGLQFVLSLGHLGGVVAFIQEIYKVYPDLNYAIVNGAVLSCLLSMLFFSVYYFLFGKH